VSNKWSAPTTPEEAARRAAAGASTTRSASWTRCSAAGQSCAAS